MESLVVIPARLGSTRLPEKLLLADTGKPVLQYTYEAALRARLPRDVLVATDSQRILDVVERFGGKAIMTDPQAASGTDRVAEVAGAFPEIDVFVNVQGDEPEIDGRLIDVIVELLRDDPESAVATLATPIHDTSRIQDPSCVKVVVDHRDRALYFSRCGIPHVRDEASLPAGTHLQHLGIYGYRREFLLNLSSLPASPLEQLEKLEQLRFLQAGVNIRVGRAEHAARGIDTMDDYRAFVSRQGKS